MLRRWNRWLCRRFGHYWLVNGNPFNLETPMHVRFCGRKGCDAEEMVMSATTRAFREAAVKAIIEEHHPR